MYEDLKEEAVENLKKEQSKRRGVYTVGFIFTAVSIILFFISLNFNAYVAYWIKFPILILALVYGIIYFSTFGFPFLDDSNELSEEEIEREMVKIYKTRSLNNKRGATEEQPLELKELEELKNKWEEDDFI